MRRPRRWSVPPGRPPFEGRPALGPPGLDRRLVPLAGPLDRLLHAPAGRPQERADVIGMVADPELAPNAGRHAPGRPDITPEAERLGPPRQQQRNLRPLLRRQLRPGPEAGPALQGLLATLAPTPHPLADGPSADPQRLRDRLLAPTLRLQRPGAQPSLFAPLPRSSCSLCHATAHRTGRTRFSLLRGDR